MYDRTIVSLLMSNTVESLENNNIYSFRFDFDFIVIIASALDLVKAKLIWFSPYPSFIVTYIFIRIRIRIWKLL